MDPLTAVALAGTIVQFVDFSCKVISRTSELYHSTNGQLSAHSELELITSDLRNVILRIQESNAKALSECSIANPNQVRASPSPITAITRICDETVDVAHQILSKLDGLKLDKKTQMSRFETFNHLCARMWDSNMEKDAIARLRVRLERLKDAVDREILAVILQNTQNYNLSLSTLFARIDGQTQLILDALFQSEQRASSEIKLGTAQLLSRLEGLSDRLYRQDRDRIAEDWTKSTEPPAIVTARVEMFTVSRAVEFDVRSLIQQSILESLKYPAMSIRYESLPEAHVTTFDWIFSVSSHKKMSWDNLATWLKTGSGIYWIGGKPGCGKSTLMKHIYDNPRTYRLLDDWIPEGVDKDFALRVATFFFWNSGTLEQRSQPGMLRSLIFQILEQEQDLIAIVFPEIWASQYTECLRNPTRPITWSKPWTLKRLKKAFNDCLTQKAVKFKLFLLIDGLDEFDGAPGDHEILADLFKGIAGSHNTNPCIKVCLASRPWVIYRDNFGHGPSLQLQDHTLDDIKVYVMDRLNANGPFQSLVGRDSETATNLASEIVSKAEGVFIWVYIVVRDLLMAVRNRDSIPDIWKRLQALPRDLEPLYDHIRSQIDPVYLLWSSKLLQILRARLELGSTPTAKRMLGKGLTTCYAVARADSQGGCPTLADIYFALDEKLDYNGQHQISQDQLHDLCEDTAFHIVARGACLLEVRGSKSNPSITPNSLVQYLHRTAKDYIEEKTCWGELLMYTTGTAFEPYTSLMRSQLFALVRLSNEREIYVDYPEIDDILDAATRVMILASCADTSEVMHNEHTMMLDMTAEILRRHKVVLDDWPQPLRHPGLVPELSTAFIHAALKLNITGYIVKTLRRTGWRDREAATFAASYFLSQIDSSITASADNSSHMSLEMARALIRNGADVNFDGNRAPGSTLYITTWESFVERNVSEDMHDAIFNTHDGSTTNPDFLQLLRLFLVAGANPTLAFGGSSLLDYIERFIGYGSSSDAELLRREVELALARWETQRSRRAVLDNPASSRTSRRMSRFQRILGKTSLRSNNE